MLTEPTTMPITAEARNRDPEDHEAAQLTQLDQHRVAYPGRQAEHRADRHLDGAHARDRGDEQHHDRDDARNAQGGRGDEESGLIRPVVSSPGVVCSMPGSAEFTDSMTESSSSTFEPRTS